MGAYAPGACPPAEMEQHSIVVAALGDGCRAEAPGERWRELAAVDGVSVYGDENLWRFWQAQGFVFWVQAGPRSDSMAPAPAELRELLRASKTLAPPSR